MVKLPGHFGSGKMNDRPESAGDLLLFVGSFALPTRSLTQVPATESRHP